MGAPTTLFRLPLLFHHQPAGFKRWHCRADEAGMWLMLAVGVLVVIVLVLGKVAGSPQRSASDERWPYSVKPVMTAPELALYRRLAAALPDHHVWPQVQVSAALAVPTGEGRMTWLNKIHQKSFDFVVGDDSGCPLVAIELDDKTHQRPSRRKADATKDRACRDAGLPLLRWTSVPPDLGSVVMAAMSTEEAPPQARVADAVDSAGIGAGQH